MLSYKSKKSVVYKSTHYKPLEIRLSLLNHNKILKRSSGEVTSSNTINYVTLEPEKGGLFCNKIFKTNYKNNYICTACSFRQTNPYRCYLCGSNTSLDKSNAQNLSMGHIDLVSPVAHPWFVKSKIIHKLYAGTSGIHEYKEIGRLIETDPEKIYDYFKRMNLLVTLQELKKSFIRSLINITDKTSISNYGDHKSSNSNTMPEKIRTISSLIRLKQRPEWMFFKVIPVLSPTYRPLRKVDDKLFIASDINFLYQRVIERNNSFKKLLSRYVVSGYRRVDISTTIEDIKNSNPVVRAKTNLQKAVIELIDPSLLKTTLTVKGKSIVNRLSGKEGRFRKDILGKRINFSGRTVITSGPLLRMNQCGLPAELILELFKPFILLKIRDLSIFSNAVFNECSTYEDVEIVLKKEKNIKTVYKLFSDIVSRHPILLNRAPTLHRLNIQAFSPLLIHTKAIQLHPLVCGSFNADFDGDTMAIYVPHTLRSQIEARLLMMTSTNLLSPATYEPIISPSKDMIFGLYYLTVIFEGAIGEGKLFNNIRDIKYSLDNKHIDIHSPILYSDILTQNTTVITTPGRLIIFQMIHDYTNLIKFDTINKVLDKKGIDALIKHVINLIGMKKASLVIDQLMSLGFYYAFRAGISLHKDDINVPNLKELFVKKTQTRVDVYQRQYARGIMSSNEKSKRLLNEWSKCTSTLTNQIFKDILYTAPIHKSSIYMLIHSGARGSMVQMRQLCGVRGLMMKPSGDILEVPIVSNFKEGLSLVDYFNSTHGARKGVIDTSFKTAVSGYLTRKLFYASKDIFIIEEDCGTRKGVLFGDYRHINYNNRHKTLYKEAIGRYLSRDAMDPYTGSLILNKDTLITEQVLTDIVKRGIEYLILRSPITCESRNGICKKCYGIGADYDKSISIGESVGILAAQSIGEPGTQLTMRTFHLGGAVLKGGSEHAIYSNCFGRVFLSGKRISISDLGKNRQVINLSRKCKLFIIDNNFLTQALYSIPYGANIYVEDGDIVAKNTLLFDWDPYSIPIISPKEGTIHYEQDYIDDRMNEERDSSSGFLTAPASDTYISKTRSRWCINGKNALVESIMMAHDTMYMLNGSYTHKGCMIGKISASHGVTQDITGGLSKISKLFECVQTHIAMIAPVEGFIVFGSGSTSTKLTVYINSRDKNNKSWRMVRVGAYKNETQLYVREHDYVYKGDVISDGILPIRDMAEKIGFQASFYNFIEQILTTYMENGVNINQKHIEVIASQMYAKVADLQVSKKVIKNIPGKRRNSAKDSGIMIKVKTMRYSKDLLHSKAISQLTMGLKMHKNSLSLGGISDVTFLSSSFLSSASFQKTSKVLTEASIWRGYDPLNGAQANLFFGYLIPLGTGSMRVIKDPYLKNNNT